MLWMFSSRMYLKRGHRMSSSVSQYLGGGGETHTDLGGSLQDFCGAPGGCIVPPTHLSTAGMLRLAIMALKRRTMWMQRKMAMLS